MTLLDAVRGSESRITTWRRARSQRCCRAARGALTPWPQRIRAAASGHQCVWSTAMTSHAVGPWASVGQAHR